MTRRLWERRKEASDGSDEALVFPSAAGTPLGDANLYKVFKPAAARAGVPWAAFHTLRHTCATALFRAGKNPKQVQAWLGHHAASFTMDVYVHLLPDDVGEAPTSFDALGSGSRDETDWLGPDVEGSLASNVL
jgi:integrase